jgi:hypothetical protein
MLGVEMGKKNQVSVPCVYILKKRDNLAQQNVIQCGV